MNRLMAWWEGDFLGEKPVAVSSNFWSVVGYTKEEIGERRSQWVSRIWKEDIEKVKEVVNNEIWEVDFRLHQKDGSTIWIRETGRWTVVENNKPKEISVMLKNVTFEKRSFERIENKEKENAKIANETMELCPIAMAQFQVGKDHELKLLNINEAGLKMWQFTSYQNAAENFVKVVSESIPEFQPDGKKSVGLFDRIKIVLQDSNMEFSTFLNIRGKETNVKIYMKKIELPGKVLVAVYMIPKA